MATQLRWASRQLAIVSAIVLAACGRQGVPSEQLPVVPSGAQAPRFDRPDAALALDQVQRFGDRPSDVDVAHLYERAERHLQEMPRYAIALDRALPAPRRAATGSRIESAAAELDRWSFLGPGNIGGRTRTLIIDPVEPNVMWTGSVSGGIWKTTNGGQRWRPVSDRSVNIAVNSLAMDPRDRRVLYAGTGEGYFREDVRGTALPLRGRGIFRSTDAGERWTQLRSTRGSDFYWVNDLVVSARGRVYAATRTGVHRSDDGGDSWRKVLAVGVNGGCLDLALRPSASSDDLLVSCGTFAQATVYRNRNAEAAGQWAAVLSDPGMGRTSLAVAPSDPDVVYALAASNRPGEGGETQQLHGLFRSDDGGSTWRAQIRGDDPDPVNRLLLTNAVVARLEQCGAEGPNAIVPMGWYVNVVAVEPLDPDTVWAAGVDLFRSSDGGRTFGPASYWWGDFSVGARVHADQHVIVFDPRYDGATNRRMFVGNDGGIYRTDNARAPVRTGLQALCDRSSSQLVFRTLNGDLGITQFYHGVVFPNGRSYVAGAQDNGTLLGTKSGGTSWQHLFGGDGAYSAVDPGDPSTLYVSFQFGNFQRSEDGGATFAEATAGLDESAFLFIAPLALDRNAPQTLWTGGSRLWRTDDGARSWRPASVALADQISAIAVAPGDSDLVVAGTRDGWILTSETATAASGATRWAEARPRSGFVTSVAFDPTDTSVLYATYARFGGRHVWRSEDAGRTWSAIDGSGAASVPDLPVHSIAIDPERPERLFLGTDRGVLVSADRGASWAFENAGFATVVTEWLEIADDERGRPSLYAFTHGRGAWRTLLQEAEEPPEPEPEPEPEPCVADETTHCLAGGRFGVSVRWRDPARPGEEQAARVRALTDDTGAFWFFDEANLELVVKVLDGRAINGHFWVFYGALSDVGYDIRVTDSETGIAKLYRNAAGNLASVADTTAFAAPGPAARTPRVTAGAAAFSETACGAPETTLCLAGERFAVTVERPAGATVQLAGASQLTADTGTFWFFDPDNLEIVLKVLDGRVVNGRFWVFFGALSDVEYTVRVRDLETGAERAYRNPAGRLASVADVEAF